MGQFGKTLVSILGWSFVLHEVDVFRGIRSCFRGRHQEDIISLALSSGLLWSQ